MSNRKLVDYDPYSGITETYHRNADKSFTIHQTQDCQKAIDTIKEVRNSAQAGFKGEMHHMASIPLLLWEKWTIEFGSDPGHPSNAKKLKAKLNSNEWQALRVKEGRM